MFFHIQELELRKVRFDVDFPPGEIDFEEAGIRQTASLHAEGVAELLNNTLGEIRIHGGLSVGFEADCDRCLEATPLDVTTDFDLFYRPAPLSVTAHEVALDEGESQIGFYEGGGIELGDILREHILLSLPMQLVCRPDCRGICPTCGANLNADTCNCEQKRSDDRWAALQLIRGNLGSKN